MECMAETVADSRYQPLHHMLSESKWDRRGVRRQLVVDANTHFGHPSALLLDESAFGKKGNMSAGVARQWNGRLGKVDNCQVGVFAAVTRDGVASVVDADLYLPEKWAKDTTRCEAVGVPEEAQTFRTKGEIALDMVMRLRREGLHFSFVAFDGGYGHLPWLLGELDGEGETSSLRCIRIRRSISRIPHPRWRLVVVEGSSAPSAADHGGAHDGGRVGSHAVGIRLGASSIRDGEKGEVMADYLTQRVWVWDGEAPSASRWHLLVRRELDGTKLKFGLSNAKPRRLRAAWRKCRERAISSSSPSGRPRAPAGWPSIRSAAGRRGTITWPWS